MSVEGAEYELLAQLLRKKMLCRDSIQSMFLEVHSWGETNHWGDAETFEDGVQPRTILAVRERLDELWSMGDCPGRVTLVAELSIDSYGQDVDESFAQD